MVIKQFYYDGSNNYPFPAVGVDILGNNYSVYQLDIHALPGTQFQFNGNSEIIMNNTGYYHWEIRDSEYVINSINIIGRVEGSAYPIIIDIVGEEVIANE